jgi:hypothetical protein
VPSGSRRITRQLGDAARRCGRRRGVGRADQEQPAIGLDDEIGTDEAVKAQRAAGPEARVGLPVGQVAGQVGVVVDAHPAAARVAAGAADEDPPVVRQDDDVLGLVVLPAHVGDHLTARAEVRVRLAVREEPDDQEVAEVVPSGTLRLARPAMTIRSSADRARRARPPVRALACLGPQPGRGQREHLPDGVVELADAGKPGGEGDLADWQAGRLQQQPGRLGTLGPGQRLRSGADLDGELPVQLAFAVAEPGGQAGHALPVDQPVGDQAHRPADHVGARVPLQRPGGGVGTAPLAGPEAAPARPRPWGRSGGARAAA